MEVAAQYVASLQKARAHEQHRRATRARKRNEYLEKLEEELSEAHRAALHHHIVYPSLTTRSMREEELRKYVNSTAMWWDTLCNQSIEQRMRYERIVTEQKINRKEYLHNVEKREVEEFEAVCESDIQRWNRIHSEFLQREESMKNESINAARKSVLSAVEQCIELLHDYCIENTKNNWLAQFTIQKVTDSADFSQPPPQLQERMFRAIFGKSNAYGLTGVHAKELLDFSYQLCDTEKCVICEFDACKVPIIILEGVKLSGKSLLADALEKQFSFVRFSDRDLVEKALQYAADEATSMAAGSDEYRPPLFSSTLPMSTEAPSSKPCASDVIAAAPDTSTQEDSTTPISLHSGALAGAGEGEALAHTGVTGDSVVDPAQLPSVVSLPNGEYCELESCPPSVFGSPSHQEMPPDPFLGVEKSTASWIEAGKKIRQKLNRGEAIDQSLTAQLLCLQILELQSEDCGGVIFEGVLTRVVELPWLLNTLVPRRVSSFEDLHALWCEGIEEEHRIQASQRAEEEAAREAQAKAEAEAAAKESEEKLNRSKSQTRASARGSMLGASSPPPIPPPKPEGIPPLFVVPKVKLDEPVKKEVRPKVPKRGVDLSQLPPPVLPEVDDIDEKVKEEESFIEEGYAQLSSYTGLLSCIININCSQEETFRRFAGLRMDRETGEQYHLLYHPPPRDRVPFLFGCDRTITFTSELYDVVFRQKKEWELMCSWLHRQPGVCDRVHELNGDQDLDIIQREAEELVRSAVDQFERGRSLYEKVHAVKKQMAERKKSHAAQVTAREAERERLAALYTEKGVPLPPELETEGETGEWCALPDGVAEIVLNSTQTYHDAYGRTYHLAWKEFSSLSCLLLEYRRYARTQLKSFWCLPDDKQVILDRFLRQFNTVPKRLRSKVACKEELHLLTDELSTTLFSSVEAKKKDAASLIDHVVRHDAYLDSWEANVCNVGSLLCQLEVERFTLLANLVILYFGAALEEPVMFEEVDTDVGIIRALEAATGDLASGGRGKTIDKRTTSARKAHNRSSDEGADSVILDTFYEVWQRLMNTMVALTEKFKQKVALDSSGKGVKKVTLRSLKLSAITAHCLPFLESEQAATLERLGCVKKFITDLVHQGERYMQSIRSEMLGDVQSMLIAQASAVNSAVFTVRCSIEEENTAPAMHLGCGTFAVLDPKTEDEQAQTAFLAPSFLTDVPLFAKASDVHTAIHETLTAARLLHIIHQFRCAAPSYQLCRDNFMTILTDEDYAGAAREGQYLLSLNEVFREFDPLQIGVIDWREVVLHLLFWCFRPVQKGETSSLFIPELTVAELLQMKQHLGSAPVTEEQLLECPFFFDKYLKTERREAYVRALWYTFSRSGESTIDPFDILCFLCVDNQPIRGMQQAFLLFTERPDHRVPMSVLERILHTRATNARAMCINDPFCKQNLYLLLGNKNVISFNEMCSCAMGRYLLNQVDFMKRKKFVSLEG